MRLVPLVLALPALGCGARVTLEADGGPLDVCACMATRQSEIPPSPDDLGPCNLCWVSTVAADQTGNGTCHFDQQRCLDEPDCFAITACVAPCKSASCVDACLAQASSELAHDLYLDWLRCFCVTCEDACGARPAKPTGICSAE